MSGVVLSAQPRSAAAREALAERIKYGQPFRTRGALSGVVETSFTPDVGRLPAAWVEKIRRDHPTYLVYSFGTPIAWRSSDGWVVPGVSYSKTTQRHQTTVRAALSGVDYVEELKG